MLVSVITLRFSLAADGFDDTPLVDFVRGKEVLGVREYFFERNASPYLAMVVTYTPPPVAQPQPVRKSEGKADDSWRTLLTRDDEPIFNALRLWRTERSRADGIPPYLLFTNQQLAEIAHSRPRSLADLTRIAGIGQAKRSRYGEAVLGVLGVDRASQSSEGEPGAEPDSGEEVASDGE